MSETPPVPPARPAWHTPVGLVLVIPAFVLLIASYVVPTVWTVWASFHRVTAFRSGDAGPFTTRNYTAVANRGLGGDFGFALSLVVIPLVILLIVAPLLAWAAHLGGTVARWVTRAVLVLPLAAFLPVAITYSQLAGRRLEADRASLVRSLYWWGTFGLVAAVTVTLYLAALRRRDPRRSPWPALLVAAGIGAAALLAVVLQEFTTPYVVTGGAPMGGVTPAVEMYNQSFRAGVFSAGAAVSTLLLAALIPLGLGVTVLAVLTGLRLEVDGSYRSADRPAGWPTSRVVGAAIAGVVLLIVLAGTLYGLGPLLRHAFGDSASPSRVSSGQIAVNTWLPPLVSSLVGVVAAALAAFGIGALRPLGRRSEWLLLPFGLFLFVGIAPLAVRAFNSARTVRSFDTFIALVPPTWLAIPALFVLTLLFRGQAGRTVPLSRQVLPALPMVALALLATWVVQAQDLAWPLLAVQSPSRSPASLELVRATVESTYRGTEMSFGGLVSPVVVVLLFLVGVAAQLLYLDRVALRVGGPEH